MLERSIKLKKDEGRTIYGYKFVKNYSNLGENFIMVQRASTAVPKRITNKRQKKQLNKNDKKQPKSVTVEEDKQNKGKSLQKRQRRNRRKKLTSVNKMEEYLKDFLTLKSPRTLHPKVQYLINSSETSWVRSKILSPQKQQKKVVNTIEIEEILSKSKPKQFTAETLLSKPWLFFLSGENRHEGFYFMSVGASKYRKINQRNINKLSEYKFDLRNYLKKIVNFSTELQDNIFYCCLSLPLEILQQLRVQYYYKDPYIRFFLINRPIQHSKRITVRQTISNFLQANHLKFSNKHRITTEQNSIILVVDYRGCVSIIRNSDAVQSNRENQTQCPSIRDRILSKHSEEVQNQLMIQKFSIACRKRLNLEIAQTNCLFAKSLVMK